MRRILIGIILSLSPALFAATASDYPVMVSQLPNLNDYSLFANAGWDGNWYVGYDTCWIKQLPSIPRGDFARAYIGVKLGRAKLNTAPAKPWDQRPLPGEVFVALSSTRAWTVAQSHLLTTTDDLPFEGDFQTAIEGTGEAQWYWTPVPIEEVRRSGPNFVAVWSPTPTFTSVSSSPVLAAGWGGKEVNTWLVHNIAGKPPTKPGETGAGLSYFQPAIALKLIPAPAGTHPLSVRLISWSDGTADHPRPVLTASPIGESIERVWVEYSVDDGRSAWKPIGRSQARAPYIFSIDTLRLPPGKVRLRVSAANVWEDRAVSDSFAVSVALPASK